MARVLYTSVAVVVLSFLFFASINAKDNLRCWSCSSLAANSTYCDDEPDTKSMTNSTCENEEDVCFKVKAKIVDGDTITLRGCANNYPTYCDTWGTKGKDLRQLNNGSFVEVTLENIKCHTCTGDNCNSASGLAASAVALLAMVPLVRSLAF